MFSFRKTSFGIVLIFILLVVSLVLQSCEKRKIEPIIETFPMNQGSEWHYQRTFINAVFESDSTDMVADVDTFQNFYKIWVVQDTVLNDTMYVTQFESSEIGGLHQKWQQYYFQDEEGLKLYGYFQNPGPITFGKSVAGFNKGPESTLEGFLEFLLPDQFSGWIFMNPPRLSLQLPLKEDSYWNYYQSNSSPNSRIDKKVTGSELIKVGGTEFACFRVELLYFDYLEDLDIHVTEWIAAEGLIKRIVKIGRISVVNLEGEYLYTAESKEVLELVDLYLN